MLHISKHIKCQLLNGYVNFRRHNFWSEMLSFCGGEISFCCLIGYDTKWSDRELPTLWMNIVPLFLLLPWRWKQYVPKSWWPPTRIHSVIIQKTTIWTIHLLFSLVFDIWSDIVEFISYIFMYITSVASNDRLHLTVFCDTSDNICIFSPTKSVSQECCLHCLI
jgi:hypothetical protein